MIPVGDDDVAASVGCIVENGTKTSNNIVKIPTNVLDDFTFKSI